MKPASTESPGIIYSVVSDGTFKITKEQWSESHCGIDDLTVRFHVTACADALNDRGFVADVRRFPAYFRQQYTDNLDLRIPSCEVVAREACRHFQEYMGARAVSVRCEVQASTVGYAIAEWHRRQEGA